MNSVSSVAEGFGFSLPRGNHLVYLEVNFYIRRECATSRWSDEYARNRFCQIPKELRVRMDERGVKTSEVLSRAIEGEEVKRKEADGIKDYMRKLRPMLDKTSLEDVAKGMGEDRDSR